MGSLKADEGFLHEMVTDILDEARWWAVLRILIEFLKTKTTGPVAIHYGFVLDRDLEGKEQGKDRSIGIDALESVIRAGLEEGTIVRSEMSDFVIKTQEPPFAVMLCNDDDIHLAANSLDILEEVRDLLVRSGFVVHGPRD